MKLVEILARELTEWPEGTNFIFQDYDGEAWGDAGNESLYTSSNICEEHRKIGDDFPTSLKDKYCSLVTRAQWEAERARIAELARGQDSLITTDATPEEWRNECQKQYEQELWDRVAASSLSGVIAAYTDDDVKNNIAHCFEYADAFMAERAKRLKGSQ